MDIKYLKLPIIIDIGSGIIKAGISGQDIPKVIFPNYIGEPKYSKVLRSFSKDNQEIQEQYIGKDCLKFLGILKLRYPVKNGIFENEQDILTIFKYIYQNLEIDNEEISEHPILITEPLLNPYSNREKIASALFENLSAPAIFFASQPILSLFSTSNTSSIILESGEGVTQSCVVYEGYSIPNSYIRNNYGGKDVTEYFQTLLQRQGYSFTTTSEFEIVKKMKEDICFTTINSNISNPLNNISNLDLSGNKNKSESSGIYNLPDGNAIKIGDEKSLAPEILFNPSIIGSENLSFQEMIISSINKTDIQIRKKAYENIWLSGGNTSFKDLNEKLIDELKTKLGKGLFINILENDKIKPQYRCWIGGNIISTLEIFKKMWVTKNDWNETGNEIVHIKTI